MSFKQCKGNRIMLDKAINDSREYYFKFWEDIDFNQKCKSAFKFIKADIYLNRNDYKSVLENYFLHQLKTDPTAYKPLIRLLIKLNYFKNE